MTDDKDKTMTQTIRGIEHIGLTVPSHARAVEFFTRAFGAEVLFSLTDKTRGPITSADVGTRNGLTDGSAIVAVSMLRLANGPNVEIFEIDMPSGDPRTGISQMGLSHFSLNVDDIDAACAAFAQAGGTLLDGPYDLTDQEEGPGNRGRFGRTPWGLLIEFEQLPSPMTYDGDTTGTRWLPPMTKPR